MVINRRGIVSALFTLPLLSGAIRSVSAQNAPLWPREETVSGAQVTIYEPQAISWPDRKTLTARAALAITPAGATSPIFGTIEISLATTTDMASEMVQLSDPKLLATHFPTLDTQRAADLEAKIRAALPHMQVTSVPLASVLLSLKQEEAPSVAVKNDPPVIFYSEKPASLLVFDGDPVLAPIGSTGISFAVNTNWDVFAYKDRWYLLNNGLWLEAPAAAGPYVLTTKLPPEFGAIAHDPNFSDTKGHIPPKPVPPSVHAPAIFVSTKPAEIIVTDGPPKLAAVPGTSLQRVANTISAVYYDPSDHRYYYLVSGRWFSAPGLEGPWEYATDKLPPEFALLPSDGAGQAILASVPGTAQAQEAVLRAQLPQTATLKRDAAKFTAVYSGAPKFAPISGTEILHAVNTPGQILKAGNKYYACYQGAWFVSSSPNGPWVLADSIPEIIYTIPPSSPLYNVTYVHAYSATPAAVTYGYTAGYMMGFITAGVLVYGTGYYYPPVVIPGPVPIYYPYPYSYGANVWYNSATGAWARGGTIYGPYGGAATAGRYYNPATGGWAQGGAIYGPYGGAGAWPYYNPRTGTYSHGSAAWGGGSGTAYANFYNPRYGVSGSTTQNANAYARWGSSTFTGPNQTVNTASGRNERGAAGGFSSSTGAEGAAYHNRATGSSGGAVKGSGGNVYAGRDGNVYRHTDTGWSKWDNGSWNPVNPPSRQSGQTLGSEQRTFRQSGQSLGSQQSFQGRRASLNGSEYRQLEQDRFGREYGSRFGGGSFGGRAQNGGERFGGGRFSGGGRFR